MHSGASSADSLATAVSFLLCSRCVCDTERDFANVSFLIGLGPKRHMIDLLSLVVWILNTCDAQCVCDNQRMQPARECCDLRSASI
jgi:hypothetical protein